MDSSSEWVVFLVYFLFSALASWLFVTGVQELERRRPFFESRIGGYTVMLPAVAVYFSGVAAAWILANAWSADQAEIVTAVAAVVIALAALGFSIYEGRATRKHNRLCVKPFLVEIVRTSGAYPRMCLAVKNSGFGPAIIKQWSLLVDGKPYRELGITRWEQLTQHLGLSGSVNYSYFEPYHALAMGDSEELVGMEVAPYSQEKADAFRAALRRLTIVLAYESLYQEDFRFEFEGNKYFCQASA